MPRTRPVEDSAMSGFPDNGDPHPGDGDDPTPNPTPNPDPPKPEPTPAEKELKSLRARLDKQDEELQQLRRHQAPPAPAPAPPREIDIFEGIDEELFRDPKGTLQKIVQATEDRVTRKLTTQYQRDRGTQKFWEDFYQKHSDLKGDHDLVEVTLNSNLAEMASMPAVKAMDRLAELTRDRILRYAGGNRAKAPKARAEGAVSPTPPKPTTEEPDKVVTLSSLIKARKDSRRRAASGV